MYSYCKYTVCDFGAICNALVEFSGSSGHSLAKITDNEKFTPPTFLVGGVIFLDKTSKNKKNS